MSQGFSNDVTVCHQWCRRVSSTMVQGVINDVTRCQHCFHGVSPLLSQSVINDNAEPRQSCHGVSQLMSWRIAKNITQCHHGYYKKGVRKLSMLPQGILRRVIIDVMECHHDEADFQHWCDGVSSTMKTSFISDVMKCHQRCHVVFIIDVMECHLRSYGVSALVSCRIS